jgi:hypothetical protein
MQIHKQEGINTGERLRDEASQCAENCRSICMVLSAIYPIRNRFVYPLHLFLAVHRFQARLACGRLQVLDKVTQTSFHSPYMLEKAVYVEVTCCTLVLVTTCPALA